jgi:hypothetical protein
MTFDINKTIPGTRSFTWHEALWCSKWQCHVLPTEQQYDEIIKIAYKLQQIRDYFGRPLKIKSWLRPKLYNELIGGAKNSYHCKGMAVDFVVEGLDCDEVRIRLIDRLDELKIRLENLPGSDWAHADNGEVGKSGRFFTP